MLLAVLTCNSATETAQRNLPTWKAHFQNIIFVTTIDKPCWVPPDIMEWKIGEDRYNDRDSPDDNLCRRTIETLEHFLNTANQSICIIEYDVVMFRNPTFSHGFGGTMFPECIHSPWLFDRATAQAFVTAGNALLNAGVISGGWPDRHLRLIYDILKPHLEPSLNYSRNTLDKDHMIEGAKGAVRSGAWACHGAKTAEQFNAVMQWAFLPEGYSL